MKIATDELLKILKEKHSIDSFLNENADEILCNDLRSEMEDMLVKYHMSKQDVILSSQIERSYLYRLLSGERANPSRDVLLEFGLALKAELDDVQKLLRIARLPMLYPRVKRDALIIHALNKKCGVTICNELLYDHNEKILSEKKKNDRN